jgi:hypothetical protein
VLTPAQVGAIESALAELLRSVEAVEAQYRESRNALWFVYEDDTTERAREAAEGRRATWERFRARRNELVELPTYADKEAAALVAGALAVARDGLDARLADELRSSPDRATFAVNVAKDTARDLTEAAAGAAPAFRVAAAALPLVLGLLALVAGWWALRMFLPGRRA